MSGAYRGGFQALALHEIAHKIGHGQAEVVNAGRFMPVKVIMRKVVQGFCKDKEGNAWDFQTIRRLFRYKFMSLSRFTLIFVVLLSAGCGSAGRDVTNTGNNKIMKTDSFSVNLTDEEWKQKLSPEEYRVLRQKGTERPFTSEYETLWDNGVYVCKGCGTELFSSATKFDAGCGWPSFYQAMDKSKVKEISDYSHGMVRTEVVCANCGGHLGHVFNDGYGQPTGLRYCINGVSLGFVKKK